MRTAPPSGSLSSRANGVDLHTHSTYSDGLLSPAALVEEAAARGVRFLALTDHDTVAGIAEARAAGGRHGVEVIPGVELSAALAPGAEVHLLGYCVDVTDAALLAGLAAYARAREERMERMVDRLRRVGAPVDPDRVRVIAGHGTVGRPHLARALVEAGHAADVADAFARYVGSGRPAFVPRPRVDPRDAIALVRAAGGVPVLAHPYSAGGVESVLDRLVPAGLAGMEVRLRRIHSRRARGAAAHRYPPRADRHRRQRLPRPGRAAQRPRSGRGTRAPGGGGGAARGGEFPSSPALLPMRGEKGVVTPR